jgi:hypothetical protein
MKEQDKENNTIENNTNETPDMKRRIKTMNTNMNNKINGNENNLCHLAFEEYFESDWRKHFQEQDTIQSILDAAGLSDSHDFVQIKSKYVINDNRLAVIVLVRRKSKDVLEKMIVDIIAGNPSFEQFLDVGYNVGSDCDYRVIMYDGNTKNHGDTLYLPEDIMSQLIGCLEGNVFVSLIEADAVKENDMMNLNYRTVVKTTMQYPSRMPDRRDFESAELIAYTVACAFEMGLHDVELWYDSYYEDNTDCMLLGTTHWKDDGIVCEIEINNDDFIWLFTKKIDVMKNDSYSCEYDKGKSLLTIKDDTPFQNFKNAMHKDKLNLSHDLFYHYARFGTFIKYDLLDERRKDEKNK